VDPAMPQLGTAGGLEAARQRGRLRVLQKNSNACPCESQTAPKGN